ncbi:MAG: S-adenosyl-l-methionine hydroxide adenosyltransferase family protein [bacterium]
MNRKRALILMSDFGLREGFVASMKGVAYAVNTELKIYDLTHLIPPFDIWEGAYTLASAMKYWPAESVFVAVVDPGVGTERKSVVLKTQTGHFVVTPDNGTLTFVVEKYGVASLREIDESRNRLPGSQDFHTFHGRDVYVYTGARLAAGVISFEQVGPVLEPTVVQLPSQKPVRIRSNEILGQIVKIEQPFGNISTNIPNSLFEELEVDRTINQAVTVEILHEKQVVFCEDLPCVLSFGYVAAGRPLLYADSQQMMGLAINGGNFAERYQIQSGADWLIKLTKIEKSK